MFTTPCTKFSDYYSICSYILYIRFQTCLAYNQNKSNKRDVCVCVKMNKEKWWRWYVPTAACNCPRWARVLVARAVRELRFTKQSINEVLPTFACPTHINFYIIYTPILEWCGVVWARVQERIQYSNIPNDNINHSCCVILEGIEELITHRLSWR